MTKSKRARVGILASGSGTTAESFIHATENGVAGNCEVALIISNNGNSGAFDVARRANMQYGLHIVSSQVSGSTHPEGQGVKGEQTLEESNAIAELFIDYDVELVLLLGYMKRVKGETLDIFGHKEGQSAASGRMLNTHPGPLPETAGLHGIHVQERVIELGLSGSAQTLHVVSSDYDAGPVVAAHRVPVLETDTPETLFGAVQLTEKANIGPDVSRFVEENL